MARQGCLRGRSQRGNPVFTIVFGFVFCQYYPTSNCFPERADFMLRHPWAEGVGHEFESYLLKLLAGIFGSNRLGTCLALLLLFPVVAGGQFLPAERPRTDFWVPDGVVHSILETNGIIYLGGEFTSLSPNLPTTAMVNAVNGRADLSFPTILGLVHCAIPDGGGGWFLGGRFHRVNDALRTNLVHLLADNTIDPGWRPETDGPVYALKLAGGALYLGGDFTGVAGQPRRKLAAVDAVSGAVLPWNPDVCCDLSPDNRTRVLSLESADSRLYVGGFFSQINGEAHSLIAAFNLATGKPVPQPDAGFDPGNFVAVLKISGNRLFVGGRFANVGGAERRNLAALDLATGIATSWNPGTSEGEVLDLAVQGRTVFIGGQFLSAAGAPRFNLAAIDRDSALPAEWAPDPDATVRHLAVSGRVIYAGGDFSAIGGAGRAGIAAVDSEFGAALDWNPETAGRRVQTLALNGDQVIVSSELHRDSKTRKRIAALDRVTGRVLDWNPGADNAVFSLIYGSNTVYVGGDFSAMNDSPRVRVAAIDAATGEILPWNLNTAGPNGRVWSLAIVNDRLFAGGGFSSVSGMFAPGIVALDISSGVPMNWRPTPNRSVFALEESGATLYAAGSFSTVASQSRRAFAQLNATAPTATGWNPDVRGAGSIGNVITRRGDTLYLGGTFTNVAGQSRRHIAALRASDAALLPWSPEFGSPLDTVQDIAPTAEAIYVAGTFTSVASREIAGLAALHPQSALPLDWNVRLANDSAAVSMRAVTAGAGALYAGGAFTSVGGEMRRNFAAFPAAGAPFVLQNPSGATLRRGQSANLVAQIGGAPPLSLQWLRNDTNIPGAVSAALALNNLQPEQTGIYRLVASNALGLVSSAPVRLLVTETLGVSRPLGNVSVSPGTNITFSIGVTGSPAPRYQWKLNGVPLPGAEGPAFSLDAVNTADSGIFNVTVFNGIDTIESARAALSVNGVTGVNADAFASRALLAGGSGTIIGHNGTATRENGEPLHAGKAGGRSLWYSWIAPASGVARFSTRGCAFDTLLAVYTNVLVGGTNVIAADDDSGGFYTSEVTFSAEAGREYQIAVDGYGGANGRVVLHWESTDIPEAVPVILRQPAGASVGERSNVVLSVGARGPSLGYQWFRSGRILAGFTNATLNITNVSTDQAGAYTVVVRSGERTVQSEPASLEVGNGGAVTQDKFQELFATNVSSRLTIGSGSLGRQVFDNTLSQTQTLEPNHGNVPGGASRWIRLRPTANVLVQIDTVGSEIDTALSIYTGTNLNSLTPFARDNNGAPDGARSLIRFTPNPAVEYQVAVDGVNGARGKICLNWQQGVPPVAAAAVATQEVRIGTSATLTAGAFGAAPAPSYRWLFNGVPVANATNASLVFTQFQATNAGTYSVIASNFAGVVTNVVAVVSPAPQLRLNYSLVVTGGAPCVRLSGPLTNQIAIEATSNLIDWSEIQVYNHVMPLDFIDADPRRLPQRFYRATLGPPSEGLFEPTTIDGMRAFRLRGLHVRDLFLERSTNLSTWSPLLTNRVFIYIDFKDPASTNLPRRFYRIRPIP